VTTPLPYDPVALAACARTIADTGRELAALGYKEDATKVDKTKFAVYKPGSMCDNCKFWTGKAGDAYGPCGLFPGKATAAKGWCSGYSAKA
jgi:hypothetical protein